MKNSLAYRKKSRIHCYGVFARTNIGKGSAVMEYKGRKILKADGEKLLTCSKPNVYVFSLDDKCDLDGDIASNLAKYLNHSCAPNCYTINIDGKIWIVASRDICKGDELTIDYGFERAGWYERPCFCGVSECFNFVVAKRHHSSLRKTKRYKDSLIGEAGARIMVC